MKIQSLSTFLRGQNTSKQPNSVAAFSQTTGELGARWKKLQDAKVIKKRVGPHIMSAFTFQGKQSLLVFLQGFLQCCYRLYGMNSYKINQNSKLHHTCAE